MWVAARGALVSVWAVGHPAHDRAVSRPAARTDGYVRRKPEDGALYRVVQAHFPAVRERAEEQGGLPKFVVREFEEHLGCGV